MILHVSLREDCLFDLSGDFDVDVFFLTNPTKPEECWMFANGPMGFDHFSHTAQARIRNMREFVIVIREMMFRESVRSVS